MVDPDTGYLTTDLPESEREKLIKGDKAALQRAKQFEAELNNIIREIEHLYYIDNLEAEEIADYLFSKNGRQGYTNSEFQETVEYVKMVIKSKLKGQ
jgi:hypothetical protein